MQFLRESMHQAASALFLCCLVAACGPSSSASTERNDEIPLTTTTSEREEAIASYPALKEAARLFTKRNGYSTSFSSGPDNSGHDFPRFANVFYCSTNVETSLGLSREEEDLAFTALEVANLETLRALGYSETVIGKPISDYEQTLIRRMGSSDWSEIRARADNKLFEALNERRKRYQPDMPPISTTAECGDGESLFYVRSSPPFGRVWLISQFAFDVCRAKHLDPWAIEKCPWREMDPLRTIALSGRYVYLAKWPNGAESRGTKETQPFDANAEPQIVYVGPG